MPLIGRRAEVDRETDTAKINRHRTQTETQTGRHRITYRQRERQIRYLNKQTKTDVNK